MGFLDTINKAKAYEDTQRMATEQKLAQGDEARYDRELLKEGLAGYMRQNNELKSLLNDTTNRATILEQILRGGR